MKTKLPRYATPAQAAASGDFPYTHAEELRRAARASRPRTDSSGRVVTPGDPELASCFIRRCGRNRGPLQVDTRRLAQVLERRRLAPIDETA